MDGKLKSCDLGLLLRLSEPSRWVIIFPSKSFRASLPSETAAMLPSYFPNDFASEMSPGMV